MKTPSNCGLVCTDCAELPCATFLQMKDPALSDEEHQKNLLARVKRLRD